MKRSLLTFFAIIASAVALYASPGMMQGMVSGVSTGPTIYTDNFTRANENPILSNWSSAYGWGGGMKIVTNQLYGSVGSGYSASVWRANTLGADQWSEITLGSVISAEMGTMVRHSTTATTMYVIYVVPSSNVWSFFKMVDGTPAQIGAAQPRFFAVGDTVRLEVVGTTLKAYINGVESAYSQTDSDISAAGRPGLYGYDTSSNLSYWRGGNAGTITATNTDQTDNFNRGTGIGANWTALTTTYTIAIASDTVAVSSSGGNDALAVWNATTYGANQFSQAKFTGADNAGYRGPCVRLNGSAGSANGYCIESVNATTMQLRRWVSGTPGNLGSSITGLADYINKTVRIEASGAGATVLVSVFVDGVQVGSSYADTDGSRVTSGQPGVYSAEGSISLDDWKGGNI